ncbi:hypothetical protein J437_LFUL008586 [Ladona fulva]|uniref:Zinc finger PHD-type domain-containing protein n=1 Tax=Ladona fulva TaxID=123851 RepID=A0A8K0P3H4_LADFU|nr:hypothetical protein J437_LFUL008586 [Ladona fulva]
MFSLSTYYDMALEKWLNNHPGRVVTLFQISQIFGEAYLKACTPMNAIKGFKKCGIYPLDSDIFTDVDFVAAETTDQAEDHATHAQKNTNMTKVDGEPFDQSSLNPGNTSAEPTVLTGSASTSSVEETDLPDDLFQPGCSLLTSCHVTDFGSVSPADVKPIPKMKGPRAVTKRRRLGATVLTSSPYKNSLVDEKRKRDEKEKRQQMKMQGRHKKAVRSLAKMNIKKRTQSLDDESSDPEDGNNSNPECIYCSDTYLRSAGGEGWIKCQMCQHWAHEQCAGIDDDDDIFVCDLCRTCKTPKSQRNLNL